MRRARAVPRSRERYGAASCCWPGFCAVVIVAASYMRPIAARSAAITATEPARARSTMPLADHATSKPMLIGYARVSTIDQNVALQRDALTEAGCQRIF